METTSPVHRGLVFPQGSIPGDPDAVREFVVGIEDLGYDHLLVPDHVLGVEPRAHPGWTGVYDIHDEFHEPLVLFGFLAGFSTLELVAGVLVLPQRQTALVAKQAAEVDLLSRGRLRLGVGIGWNDLEYEGMGAEFRTRGQRMDEQVVLLRRLWTQECVSFTGDDHLLRAVGISPLPTQRPIPLWIAAESAPRAFARVGRLADGWMAMGPPVDQVETSLRLIRDAALSAGRDPDRIGVQAWVSAGDGDVEQASSEIRRWRDLGATHVAVNTRGPRSASVRDHLTLAGQLMRAFDAALDT